ncbi:hypothetical protein ACWEPH_08245 [Nocardia beijingensis]
MHAEFMCQVHLLDLTLERARAGHIHRLPRPDECVVHLEASCLLLIEDDD